MGDENSLAGTTKAHKHTSPASDGGFLETTETGVTNMSEGSIGYYDSSSVLTELSSGSSGNVLTMGAAVPAWGSAGGGEWTSLVQLYDQNAVDTGYVDMKNYRWLDVFVSGHITATDALEMKFYNPDGVLTSGGVHGTAGFFGSNTYYTNSNQSEFQLTFGQAVGTGSGNFGFGMRVNCSPVGKPDGGTTTGNYWFSKRESYDCTYCSGNLYLINGFTDSALQFCNGFKFTTNSFTDVLVSVYGAGDNTS